MKKRKFMFLSLVAGALIASATLSHVTQAAESVTKTREAGMKSMGKALKTIKQLIDSNGDKAQIAANAQTIIDVSAKIPTWFPKEAGAGEAAKPEIWEQWDKFQADAKNLNTQATQLQVAANGGSDMSAIQAQFQMTGKACGTCHETFKKKDD
ncbi:MAG: cytochrome c [Dongiaceae bacterium]